MASFLVGLKVMWTACAPQCEVEMSLADHLVKELESERSAAQELNGMDATVPYQVLTIRIAENNCTIPRENVYPGKMNQVRVRGLNSFGQFGPWCEISEVSVPCTPPLIDGFHAKPIESIVPSQDIGVFGTQPMSGALGLVLQWEPYLEIGIGHYEVEMNTGSGFKPLSEPLTASNTEVSIPRLPDVEVIQCRLRGITLHAPPGPWTTLRYERQREKYHPRDWHSNRGYCYPCCQEKQHGDRDAPGCEERWLVYIPGIYS